MAARLNTARRGDKPRGGLIPRAAARITPRTMAREKSMGRAEATYAALCSCFVVVLVLTNIIGVKLFSLPEGVWWLPRFLEGEHLTTGIITYPLTFLLTDVVAEIWGRRRASYMVVLGFGMSLMMLVFVNMAKVLPPSAIWANPDYNITDPDEMQRAFGVTFAYPQILLFASMAAYLVAQLFDVRLYHFWWRVTKGRWMFIRNNGSTSISQLVDTIIVNSIFLRWGLEMEWPTIWSIIVAVYVCKLILALIDTPLIYLGRYVLREFLGLEHETAPEIAPLAR